MFRRFDRRARTQLRYRKERHPAVTAALKGFDSGRLSAVEELLANPSARPWLSDVTPFEARLYRLSDEQLDSLLAVSGPPSAFCDRIACLRLDRIFQAEGGDPGAAGREAVRDLCARLKRHGEMPAQHLYLGALDMLAGDRANAYARFRRAARLNPGRRYVGAHSIRRFSDMGDWRRSAKAPDGIAPRLSWLSRPKGEGPVLLFGADAVYFRNFADHIVDQARALGDVAIHFHFAGWDENCVEQANALAPHGVTASWEPLAFEPRRAWFVTARYYRLAELLEELARPIIVTDLDADLVQAPESAIANMPPFDIAIRAGRHNRYFPWWAPSGANLFAEYTPAARAWALDLRAYIGCRLRYFDAERGWWFDQLALNETLHFAPDELRIHEIEKGQDLMVARSGREVRKLKRGFPH